MDVFGQAVKEYYSSNNDSLIISVSSELAGEEEIPVSYLFRDIDDMPDVEQKALELARGHVLDIGACAGAHAMYLQEDRGLKVTALEVSQLACDVMEERGVKDIIETDFYTHQGETYDTLLLLMNGIGIAERKEKVPDFLSHCKSLLAPGGKIYLESSDIIYMFEEEDGSVVIDLNGDYYGHMNYTISFDEVHQKNFDWLYLSYDLLQDYALMCGFKIRKVMDGEHYNYLAELSLK